jgi:hypothetical protein
MNQFISTGHKPWMPSFIVVKIKHLIMKKEFEKAREEMSKWTMNNSQKQQINELFKIYENN